MNDTDKNKIIELIKAGEKLPKEFIYKLFADEEDVFLFWNGRKEDTTNIALPFHSIEHIDEPRKETKKQGDAFSMFETDFRGRQLKGWTNKLIWGDNKLILSSLANGPMREEIEKEGGLKLISIDPPFAVGADFGFNIEIGGEIAEKKQSIIEEIAYRDTWGKGISSYLTMMYERLKLMHNLLAEDGSIYVHVDYRVSAYLRMILDDVFGNERLVNELIWKRTNVHSHAAQGTKHYSKVQDTILFYSKTDKYIWDQPYGEHNEEHIINSYKSIEEGTGRRYSLGDLTATDGGNKGNPRFEFLGVTRYWRWNKEKMEELYKQNRIVQTSPNSVPRQKRYLDESKGLEVGSLWIDINPVQAQADERIGYPTQKPEALLERIIKASSNEGDLCADFFGGSGTLASVAEKLGRKWISCDLGRFAIHTQRKRLIGVQRELQANGKNFRAFELLNLGKYERQFFMDNLTPNSSPKERGERTPKEDLYVDLILEAYKAKRIDGHSTLHGSKAGRFVNVGPLDVPVTQSRLMDIFEECRQKLYTQVDVLGFEFEMGLTPQFIQELKEKGVSVTLKYIPKDVFDKRAVEKGQVKFFDVAYLDVRVHTPLSKRRGVGSEVEKSITIELTDFVTHYTQDDIEELQQSMRAGSKVVIEDGQIFKIEKDKNGIITRTVLTKNWFDWIDYWAIDFNYLSKKEIIKLSESRFTGLKDKQDKKEKSNVGLIDELNKKEKSSKSTNPTNPDSDNEYWTGNYIFENEWQSFRTKKTPILEFTSIAHEYKAAGKYKVMVKVVDILGIDTSKIVDVVIK